jgi:hypothetical protein
MSLVQAYLVTLAQEELLRDVARQRLAHRPEQFEDVPADETATIPAAPRRVLARAAVGVSRLAGTTAHRLDPRVEVSIRRRVEAGC